MALDDVVTFKVEHRTLHLSVPPAHSRNDYFGGVFNLSDALHDPMALMAAADEFEPLRVALGEIYAHSPAKRFKHSGDFSQIDKQFFDAVIVPELQAWWAEPLDWTSLVEVENIDNLACSETAALDFFERNLEWARTLGIQLRYGEGLGTPWPPGAMLAKDRDLAQLNDVALAAGIPVRFVEVAHV